MSQDILILGGGPAGMAAAMELSRKDIRSTVVEKAAMVGGLAKTLEFKRPEGTYRTDIGPHRFFSKNKYLYDFIEDLLGHEWITVNRLTRFYVDGKYYFYPVRLGNVLLQMGPLRAARVLVDFLWEKVRKLIAPRKINSFEDYAVSNFGRSLAEFNMLNYTEKIWGIPCVKISKDWALQRIGGLSIGATLKKIIMKKTAAKSLVDIFYYPENGSGTIYEAIVKRIREKGSEVMVNSEPTAIRWNGKRVTAVDVKTEVGAKTYDAPKAVISSVSVTQAVTLFDPPAPQAVLDAAKTLKFRSQVYLFLTVKKDRVSRDNWVYFPDKTIPFGRFSEMKNFSEKMCPSGYTSLFVEYFCFFEDDIWNKSKEDLFELTITWLDKLGFLKREDVTGVEHLKQRYVYPIYDLTYRENLDTVITWLDGFENFYAIGRPGRFRYTNQDHSLEMGILAAQSVIDGRRHDVEDVGAEKEYFERGYVPGEKKA